MKRYRYMRRKTEVHRQERTFHRWLAWFMAAVLLMGECNLSVFAEEITSNIEVADEVLSDEAASDEVGDILPEETEELDESNTDDIDNTEDIDSTEDIDELPDDEESRDENICICDSVCGEDSVNEDCPVCAADYGECRKRQNCRRFWKRAKRQ